MAILAAGQQGLVGHHVGAPAQLRARWTAPPKLRKGLTHALPAARTACTHRGHCRGSSAWSGPFGLLGCLDPQLWLFHHMRHRLLSSSGSGVPNSDCLAQALRAPPLMTKKMKTPRESVESCWGLEGRRLVWSLRRFFFSRAPPSPHRTLVTVR